MHGTCIGWTKRTERIFLQEGKHMAKWYEEAVFYHIYPIGLLGAPRKNEGGETEHRFARLTAEWLPHIAELGCSAVYIGPLFASEGHGYETTDYRKVDRRLGDEEDFIRFVSRAHELGIRVVVDGVFNHTGRSFFAFQDLLEKRESSAYRNWYRGVNFGGNNGHQDGFCYECWHGYEELPRLNPWENGVQEYLLDTVDFWIDTFGIDGIRLDCADCLEPFFMEALRARTQAKKEDFWLMGEVIHGDYAQYIGDGTKRLHSVTNYELWKGLYSGHNSHNYFEIAHTIRREFGDEWGIYRGLKLYTFADNHDVNRLASLLNDQRNLKNVYTLVYLLPGIPSIYYGSEFGIAGRKEDGGDDALRPALDLQELLQDAPHPDLPAWLVRLAELRKEYPACVSGKYRELYLTNGQYAFMREDGLHPVLAVLNNEDRECQVQVPFSAEGTVFQDIQTGEEAVVKEGRIQVKLDVCSSRVFVVK